MGCKKSIEPIIDVDIFIHYVDSSGNELFANGANGYITSNVRLYYEKSNVKQMVYTAPTQAYIPDYPYGCYFDSSFGMKQFIFFSNVNVVSDTSIIFIDLKPNVEDTLKCKFSNPNSNPSSIECDSVWYNRKLVSRRFTITK